MSPDRKRRSLSQTGGPVETSGNPAAARALAACLDVDPGAPLAWTHGFHAYPARMHPETARRALEAFPGGPVLDPFVGSGTTALEALRAGRAFTGIDVSRVALEIAWARTRAWPPERCRRFESAARRRAARAAAESDRAFRLPPWAAREGEWYDPHTLREICLLKGLLDEEPDPEFRRLFTVVLSSLAVKLSRQVSDSDVRIDPRRRPRPRHAAFRAFADRAEELTRMLLRLSSDLHRRGVRRREPELRWGDARTVELPAGGYELVLSSPPYPGTYDYAAHQERRYPLFGIDASFERAHEIGARRTGGAGYAEDMDAVLGRLGEALAPGGRMVLLVGDGRDLRADRLFAELAARHGMRLAAAASQRRRDWTGGPPRREHLLLIERP
jgi:SAM-dependent methyltransferase